MTQRIKIFLPALFIAVFLTMGITCFAADSDFQFDIETGTITGYHGTDSNVTIPTTIAGYPVTKIERFAFKHIDTLESLTINSNIEEIGESAFSNNENLKTLVINANTLTIVSGAFYSAVNLENVTINCTNSIFFDGSSIFYDCDNLKSITLPNGTKNLSYGMFSGCSNLETVILPNGLEEIDEGAFRQCYSLKNIIIPSTVNKIGNSAFMECTSLEAISIPNSVTGDTTALFRSCKNLKEVTIGNGITKIGNFTFEDAIIEELTLPASVKNVDDYGFYEMNSLSKLTIMNDEIDLNDSLKKIPTTCVVYCGADSNGLKAAIGAGLKYVIIETPSKTDTSAEQTAASGTPVAEVTAVLSSQSLSVNGNSVSVEAYNINGSNYFKLRDVASIVNGTEKQFAISYNNSTNSISMISGSAYQAVGSELQKTGVKEIYATPSIAAITLDGTAVTAQAYNINGSNYFKLRDLASLLDFGIDYDSSTGMINIVTSTGYTA